MPMTLQDKYSVGIGVYQQEPNGMNYEQSVIGPMWMARAMELDIR